MFYFSLFCLIAAVIFLVIGQMDHALWWLGLAIYNKIPVRRKDD